jgi:photosystem I P700 chlorophyll a apoprotein A1
MFSYTTIQLQPIIFQWIQNTHASAPGSTTLGAIESTSLT